MTGKHSYYSGCTTVVLLTLLRFGTKMKGAEASVQFHHESMDNQYQFSDPSLDKFEQPAALMDQKLTVRLPLNTLLKYTSYKDVSILHFRVPLDTKTAYYSFKAVEESKSAFQRKCKPKDITLHLKANSFPVISPENITFPKNFMHSKERFKIYNLQFRSDQKQNRIDIEGPQIGSWFAVAFVSWTDPNNDRIEQQGLAASCETLLLAELSVTRFNPTIINNGQVATGNLSISLTSNELEMRNVKKHDPIANQTVAINNSQVFEEAGQEIRDNTENYSDKSEKLSSFLDTLSSKSNTKNVTNNEVVHKFYVPEGVEVTTARLNFATVCEDCPDIGFYIQANAYPLSRSEGQSLAGNEFNYLHSTVIRPNQTEEISINFYVQTNTWHYILLKFLSSNDEFVRTASPDRTKPTGDTASSIRNRPILSSRSRHRASSEEMGTEKHYVGYTLQIDFDHLEPSREANRSEFQAEAINKSNWEPEHFHGMDFYSLLRQSYHEFFMFDYDLQPDGNGTVPALLNLTALSPAAFAFELGEVNDIGGTLTFAISMKPELHSFSELKQVPSTMSPQSERDGIIAEKLVSNSDEATAAMAHERLARGNQSMQIIVCMHLGVPGVPTWPDKCRYGHRLLPASSIINNTDSMTLIHVPFPESGVWFTSMGLFCHGAETARVTIIDSVKDFVREHKHLLKQMRNPCPCATLAKHYASCLGSQDCLASLNETETLKVKECMMDFKCNADYLEVTRLFDIHQRSATEQHFALENCNTSIIFSISSSPCVAGRCGRFGRCYHYMSGGFVFSTCVCMKGYRGWDCTDDSQVPSSMSILMASLLLTLSNLLFIPSIYLAFRRRYYTEGVIYFFAMFFSIFYHACDSGEDEYSFCLVKIGVLQFCDFYCGLLAIWVTLIAMAHIPQQFVSLLSMFGAILLAFGTELNKQSLWVFLAPALTGICLISTSWGIRCSKTRKWFPARRYLTIFMPLGLVLVMVGLVCYAFLQTKQNYHIVHSIWHMVMAMSIMCLLPSRKSFMPKS